MKGKHVKPRIASKSVSAACLLYATALICMNSCGGSSPPPPPDFGFSVTPSAVSITVGTYSPALLLSVSGKDGFSDTVSVSIKGLPPGSASVPSTPFAIPPNGSQSVTFFIPPSTPTGSLSIELDASGGSISHNSVLNLTVTPVSNAAVLQETSGQVAAETIEIQSLSAGEFNPRYWQEKTLNWVPDVRAPVLAPQTTGPYQNIYAPWPLEQANGWRLFYGGWDGQDVPYDQIFSVATSDFLSFVNRDHIIANGAFLNVNNVNVQPAADGSLHMICTGGQAGDSFNKPVYFSSPDGVTWNNNPEPYTAQLTDVISIEGYSGFSAGNFNGANVLLRDNGSWVLYFKDWNNFATTYRATAVSLPNFHLQSIAINSDHLVNDVKKFVVNGTRWYLMGLHFNAQSLWYSLSNDGVSFSPEQSLFRNLSAQDEYIVALGFVTKGSELLGVLYGAGAGGVDADHKIFARWLQKRVVITDASGTQYFPQGGYGPDRQWFQTPASGFLEGTMVVYAEDGIAPLGSSLVSLGPGKAYALVLR